MTYTHSEETTETFTVPQEEAVNKPTEATVTPAQESQSDYLRLQAEYFNYRKRVERDRDLARETTLQSTLSALLPVLDDIDAARNFGDLVEGPSSAIINKLDGILGQLGLTRINEVDVEFNPEIHEAVITQASEIIKNDNIIQVFRSGYVVGTKVIRPAQVMVSNG